MEFLDSLITGLTGISAENIDPLMSILVILGIIIALRILVRVANATIKIGCTVIGILVIFWIITNMV